MNTFQTQIDKVSKYFQIMTEYLFLAQSTGSISEMAKLR